MRRAFISLAMCRFLWRMTVPMSGATAISFYLMNQAIRLILLAYHLIIFRRRDNVGAIRCIVGTRWRLMILRGGVNGLMPPFAWLTLSVWITSVALQVIGQCQPARKPRSMANGDAHRAKRYLLRSKNTLVRCPSLPKIWA